MHLNESGSNAITWTLQTRVQDVTCARVRGVGLGVGVGLNDAGKGLKSVCAAALASGLEAGASSGWWTFHSILGGLASAGLLPPDCCPLTLSPDPVS